VDIEINVPASASFEKLPVQVTNVEPASLPLVMGKQRMVLTTEL
jgi:hypothetical protein